MADEINLTSDDEDCLLPDPTLFPEDSLDFIVNAVMSFDQTVSQEDKDEELKDQLFLDVCQKISVLTPENFSRLEEFLIQFVVRDWKDHTDSCFRTLTFVVDVFIYIGSIASKQIVQQYLQWFSVPSMPSHISLCLYPALVVTFGERFGPDSFSDDGNFINSVERFVTQRRSPELTADHAFQLTAFWKKSFQFYVLSPDSLYFPGKLLNAFVTSHDLISALCQSDEHRNTLFRYLARCLQDKPTKEIMLMASLLVIYLRNFPFTQKTFGTMRIFLERLSQAASHHKNQELTEFITDVITDFISVVHVPEENLVLELCKKLNINIHSMPSVKSNDSKKDNSEISNPDREILKASFQDSQTNCTTNESMTGLKIEGKASVPIGIYVNGSKDSQIGSGGVSSPGNSGNTDKLLNMLEKICSKMKSTNARMTNSNESDRMRIIISDLSSFM